MADTFAKLFDTPHGQLLAFKSETDEGDPSVTVMGAAFDGVRPTINLSGWDDPEAGQQQAFDKIDAAQAEAFAARLHAFVAGLGEASNG